MGRIYANYFVLFLLLSLGFFTTNSLGSSIQDRYADIDASELSEESGIVVYVNHDIYTDQVELQGTPIRITSDGDFLSQATSNGWPGDGSSSNPIVIGGLTIVTNETSTSAIDIQNTNVHFIIRDCILTASDGSGILFNGVSNGTLINNTMSNNGEYGVRIDDFFVPPKTYNIQLINNTASENERTSFSIKGENHTLIGNVAENTPVGYGGYRVQGSGHVIRYNTAIGTGHGIYLQWANDSVVESNYVHNSHFYGIELYETTNISIVNNNVTNTGGGAFSFWSANHTAVINNSAHTYDHGYFLARVYNSRIINNSAMGGDYDGLVVQGAYNEIRGNTVTDNRYGLRMTGSTLVHRPGGDYNQIINNTFSNNFEYGMQIANSTYNIISNNTIENNEFYGITFDYSSGFNNIETNQFISNNYMDVQAFSDNSTNKFDKNYWSDYEYTDSDGDGYGEQAYLIDGGGLCTDEHPIVMVSGLPRAPINLMVTPGLGNLSLSWNPAETSDISITEYVIYRSGDMDKNYVEYIRTSDTNYVDSQVTPGVEYFYRITAINNIGESDYSAIASGVPLGLNQFTSSATTSSQDTTTSTTTSTTSPTAEIPSIDIYQVITIFTIVTLIYSHRIDRSRNRYDLQ